MTRRGEAAWSADEAVRFFDAFHQHGQDWPKVAEALGGERSEEACASLYRKQQAYLSIPKSLQSDQAFAAIVENAQKEEAAAEPSQGGSGAGEEAAASGAAAASRLKQEEGEVEEGREDEDEEGEDGGDARTLAAARTRRTPKRGVPASPGGIARASGRRTPVSGVKRSRGGGTGSVGRQDRGDIYEYYDEGAELLTESARKRRVARQRLDFAAQGSRRRHDADEAKGIDALLALAVAGEESALAGTESDGGEEEGEGMQQAAARHRKAPKQRGLKQRSSAAAGDQWEEEEEEEEEPADAGAMDDEEDEDFAPPPRRTPYSTPSKAGRLPRPGSAHATPRRSGSRGGPAGLAAASPGLGLRGLSPYMMSVGGGPLEGGDMLSDLGLADLGYIASPGFPHFPPGFVPSPQNPMPRLRRRKSAPERLAPAVASPVKMLFTRRSSLVGGPSLMAGFGYAPTHGSSGEEEGGNSAAAVASAPQTAVEARLRHCLQQPRTQRWAASEFCYSALDRPFFMFNPLAGLLAQLGLGDNMRLTGREWALIRSGLGKPRRLSLKFLKEERARLERWREGCRQQYQSGAAAAADPKVADHLPRPLSVGQRVVARHPATRQLHDGSVLTAAHNCYRVQFDRQELGVELVRDTDVMPAEPAENLPPALLAGRAHLVLNGRHIFNGQPLRPLALRRPMAAAIAASAAAAGATPLAPSPLVPGLLPAARPDAAGSGGAPAQQPQGQQQQARAADAKALAELVVGLDKKEALLLQLRGMNDEAAAGVHTDGSGTPAPQFVNAYATVVLELEKANGTVKDKLEQLDRPSSSGGGSDLAAGGGGGSGASPLEPQQLDASLAADAELQIPEAFSGAALEQAQGIIAACRSKLAQSTPVQAAPDAASQAAGHQPASQQQLQEQQQQVNPAAAAPTPLDWSSSEGQRLGSLIQGCVHSLVLLLRGAQAGSSLPHATLSAALEQALVAVQPSSRANHAIYEEIQEALNGLSNKLQVSAAS